MTHPDSALVAAFAEGKLQEPDLAIVADHLSQCADCRRIVGETVRFLRETASGQSAHSRFPWIVAAAAAVVAIVGVMFWTMHRDPLAQLIAAAPRDIRFVEPRLSGFPAAPLASSVRGVSDSDPRQMRLTGAAGTVLEKTSGDRSPNAIHAIGVAQLLTSRGSPQVSVAISSLSEAAAKSIDPTIWNDLAAARYSAREPQQLPQALAAADQALDHRPAMPEALFNRALILTALGMHDEAIAAWNRYLETDSAGPFADEARSHLQQLLATPQTEFPRAIGQAIASLAGGDEATAKRLLATDAGEVRSFFETEGPALWAEALLRGDATEARRQLGAARTVGAVMQAFNGEPIIADIVAAIDRAGEPGRRVLARAHIAYRDGRYAYRPLRKPRDSERLLSDAATGFKGRSPMELLARTYCGVAILGQNRTDDAWNVFNETRRVTPAKYKALSAYLLWQRASCVMTRAAWSESIDDLLAAINVYEATNEKSNAAYVHDILSQVYDLIGNRENAWHHRSTALQNLGLISNHRLEHVVGGIVYDALKRHEWREAMSFLDLEVRIANVVRDKELLSYLFLRRTLVSSRLRDPTTAEESLRQARAIVASIDDVALRQKLEIEVKAASALISNRPEVAISVLSEVVQFHEHGGWRVLLPDLYLRRGRMYLLLGQKDLAAADFESGIVELERERDHVHPGNERWGVFDTSEELFDAAVDLALPVRPDRAFDYAERESDAPGTFEAASIPTGTAVVRYISLPDKLAILIADRHRCLARQLPIRRETLVAQIAQFTERVRAGKLDDLGIGDQLVPRIDATELVFVPDAYTSSLPFAAMLVAGRPLIEKYNITVGPSAQLCLRARERFRNLPRRTALVLDNPSNDSVVQLAHARAEADAIQSQYVRVDRFSGSEATAEAFLDHADRDDVIHFAGHGVSTGPSASIVLAPTADRSGNVDTTTIARLALSHTDVVVLASCGSAAGAARTPSEVLSVAYAFLRAGAPAVIATLWPIDDREAAEFFPRLHRHLAHGERAAVALRETQLECIHIPACSAPSLWAAVQALGS